jgi:hypothetical protein
MMKRDYTCWGLQVRNFLTAKFANPAEMAKTLANDGGKVKEFSDFELASGVLRLCRT